MNKFADKEYFRKPADYRLVNSKKSKYDRVDAYEKVTGLGKFAGDFVAQNMLYVKAKHAPYARAKILSIDTSKAEALPGVKCVLTGKDFKQGGGSRDDKTQSGAGRTTADIEIINFQTIRMYYDVVAAVGAVDEYTAAKAVGLIDVKYEELPGIFDPREAMKEGAIDVQGYGWGNNNLGPCCDQVGSNGGKNIDDEFARAALVTHRDFETQ
jgi:CO/xanthine dehydrogenase Mo-binding subunit